MYFITKCTEYQVNQVIFRGALDIFFYFFRCAKISLDFLGVLRFFLEFNKCHKKIYLCHDGTSPGNLLGYPMVWYLYYVKQR